MLPGSCTRLRPFARAGVVKVASVLDRPMSEPRVLILSTYFFPVLGGSETHARQIASYLHRHGFGVMVVTKRVGREAARNDVVDGVPVHRVPPCGPRSGFQKWLMTPSVLWTMVRRRHDFDVVYSPDYRGIGLAGLLAARLLGKPAVMGTAALGVINAANLDPLLRRFGIRPGGAIARLVKRPFHRVYTSADAYPAITRAIAEEAVAAGVAPGRVHYLPNSVDTARFAPASAAERSALRAELGLPPGETVCLFLARLSREKGLMDLMAAWREIDAQATRLVVVGPDMTGHPFDVGPAAREFASKHRMEDRVKFVGPTSAPERWLRAADVMAQPSHWEAAPFGVVEAMASGLAIVATRVGGMAEFLEDGRDAVLCAPRDIRGLSAALTRVLGDPGLRERLGAAARATAVREFDQGAICARYAALFRQVAAAPRFAGPANGVSGPGEVGPGTVGGPPR